MVCASNVNRSMEAHALLKKQGYTVESFGVGGHVKLPGPSAQEPNVYTFGTPYAHIYEDLKKKDTDLYTRTGMLRNMQRNMAVKTAPERWQENTEVFDVVVSFEERVFDVVEEVMVSRRSSLQRLHPSLLINLEVKDSHEEAAVAAPQALRLAEMLETSATQHDGSWVEGLEKVLDQFELETGRRPTYSICWT